MQIEMKMAYMQTVISKTLYTVLLLCTSVGLQMEIKQHTQNILFAVAILKCSEGNGNCTILKCCVLGLS